MVSTLLWKKSRNLEHRSTASEGWGAEFEKFRVQSICTETAQPAGSTFNSVSRLTRLLST